MPIKLHGKEYYTVVERIKMLQKTHKTNYSLETSVNVINNHILIVKAVLTVNEHIYTGHSIGDLADGKPKTCEATETHAIGRCLASFGLSGGEFASADEIVDFQKQTSSSLSNDGPSEKQIALIRKRCNELQEDFDQRMVGITTKKLASELIEELLALDEQQQMDAI